MKKYIDKHYIKNDAEAFFTKYHSNTENTEKAINI